MDMNVYNTKIPGMNPSDLNMIWMGHFAPDRSVLFEENSTIYNQPMAGMSVIDDLTQQTHAMDMNPMMGMIGDFHTTSLQPSTSNNTTGDIYGLQITNPQSLSGYQMVEDNNCEDEIEEDEEIDEDEQCYEETEFKQEYETENDNYSNYVIDQTYMQIEPKTISTQTHLRESYKKIQPVKRPGLVLKTPIAYQGDIDPSVIPIRRDGMAVCQKCGAIGVKHSFYTRQRRFCSMSCARGFDSFARNFGDPDQDLDNSPQRSEKKSKSDIESEILSSKLYNPNYRFKMSPENEDDPMLYRDYIPQEEVPQIPNPTRLPSPCPQDEKIQSVRRKQSEFYNSYDWTQLLNVKSFNAAKVACFSHAPGYDTFPNIGIEMKVEVENTDCDNHGINVAVPHSFWVGMVLRICGYKALIRYEGFDQINTRDFWVNLCSGEVHPVGWCATRGKPLIPPRTIENKYRDWKALLVKRLSGARTLPSTFYNKINDSLKSRFRIGLNLEVVDKNHISQVKLATVNKIVGKRLYVRYFDGSDDNGFWCHEDSPLIHPVGWASAVGHNLAAPPEYLERVQNGYEQSEDDSTIDYFKLNFNFEEHYLEDRGPGFMEGMKLEAIDPLNLSSICVATVMAVLKYGYIMIRIDSYDPDIHKADWFCYHEKSPCIFPVGFCTSNGIPLTPPKGYEADRFNWEQYLSDTNCTTADESLFNREIPNHKFRTGMKVECADLMDPRLVCVATIARVVGRLLKVHFDGWEDEYDQWLDCESPDMYPVGWCVLVGHKLEGPPQRVIPKITQQLKVSPKSKRKKRKKVKLDTTVTQKSGIMNTRGTSVKKDKELFDKQKLQNKESLSQRNKQNEKKNSLVRIKAEPPVLEPVEIDVDFDESFSSEQTSPSSVRSSDQKPNLSYNEDKSRQSSSNSPSLPPQERKPNSYISNSTVNCSKYIPRIIDTNNSPESTGGGELLPDTWNIYDVAQFLRVNDCTTHCETFSRNKVDGKKLLFLTKDEIIEMLGMKVGPAIKIFDLIQQLKCKIDPIQSRLMKSNLTKKFL